MATKEYFPGIGKIKFEGKESKNLEKRKYPRRETTVSSSGNHRVLVRERQGNCNHLLYKTLV